MSASVAESAKNSMVANMPVRCMCQCNCLNTSTKIQVNLSLLRRSHQRVKLSGLRQSKICIKAALTGVKGLKSWIRLFIIIIIVLLINYFGFPDISISHGIYVTCQNYF